MPAATCCVCIVAFLSIFLQGGRCAGGSDWGYTEKDGPDMWKGKCQDSYGRQSPIDIRASEVDYTPLHRIHFIHYDHPGAVEISNTGTSLLVKGFDKWAAKQPMIQGGGLKHRYKLVQFHLHWGQQDSEGSEHTLGSLHYPAELHLVHLREGLSITEAKSRPDGIAVIGVFLAKTHDPVSNHFSALGDYLRAVEGFENKTDVVAFRPRHMLPHDTEAFYRYEGSLTTPFCDEAVVWTILAEPISISAHQLHELRALRNQVGVLGKNFRPTQPINGRRILYRPSKLDRALLCSAVSTSRTSLAALFISFAGFLSIL